MDSNCLATIVEEFGISHKLAKTLYREAELRLEDLGVRHGDRETIDEFVRGLDDYTRKALMDGVEAEVKEISRDKTARAISTHLAVQRLSADVNIMLKSAEVNGRMRVNNGFLGSLGTMDPIKALRTILLGSNSGVTFARKSVSTLRAAFHKELTAPVYDLMQGMPEISHLYKWGFFGEKAARLRTLSQLVADSMLKMDYDSPSGIDSVSLGKETGDMAAARKIAKVFAGVMDRSVDMLNQRGAGIRKMQGYLPNAHDYRKVFQNREAWMDTLMDTLDWDKSFPNIDPPGKLLKTDAERRQLLERMYESMLRRDEKNLESPFRIGDNVKSRFEHHREMYFKNGEAWHRYHKDFGTTDNVVGAMLSQLELRSRMLSLMDTFGPDPEKGLMLLKGRIVDDINSGKIKVDDAVKPDIMRKLNALDVEGGHRIIGETSADALNPPDGGISMAFAEVAGETMHPVNAEMARIASTVRVFNIFSKLGRAVLSSVVDVPNAWMSMVRKGMPSMGAWDALMHQYVQHWKVDDLRGMSHYMSAYYDDLIGAVNSRHSLEEAGSWARETSLFFRLSTLSTWTDFQRGALARTNMNWFGDNASRAYDALPTRLQETLKYHGISARKWDMLRSTVQMGPDGKPYITPEGIRRMDAESLRGVLRETVDSFPESMPHDVRRIYEHNLRRWMENPGEYREQLVLEYSGMLTDEVRYGVIEADDKARYFLLRGTQPGTLAGELLRFSAMFKTYPIGIIDRAWSRQLFMGNEGTSVPGLPAHVKVDMDLARWIAATTLGGYISIALSDISKGYEPRPMFGDHGFNTFLAAIQKGGVGGIYGDAMNDMMRGFDDNWLKKTIALAGGPVADTGLDALDLIVAGINQDKAWAHKAYKFALNNAPYANLWYGRQAFDYAIGWHMEEYLNPGAVRRRQAWNEREMGRTAYARP